MKGPWRYLYCAVDQMGQTIHFLLTEQRDEQAATRVLTQAIRCHRVPATITITGGEANAAAIRGDNKAHGTAIIIRHVHYLNTIVEQDHRGVKRDICPRLGFKFFAAAPYT
jgi:putative transposase